jgi:hypothetical protein
MIPLDPLQTPAVVLGMMGAVLVAGRTPGVRVWSVGGRECVLGGVRDGDGEPVRDGDVCVLLGDGGGGGEEYYRDRFLLS